MEALGQEIIDLLNQKDTVKALATVDSNGVPHVAFKQSIRLDDDGNLLYLELLESSQTNKNMTESIWFNREVSVALSGKNGRSYLIKGKPVKAITSGPIFQKHYKDLLRRSPQADLATVWIIKPDKVVEQSYATRRIIERETRPYFIHLDQIARKI